MLLLLLKLYLKSLNSFRVIVNWYVQTILEIKQQQADCVTNTRTENEPIIAISN